MKTKLFFLIAGVAMISFQSCTKEEDPCDTNPTYNSEIAAIINGNCTNSSCHGSGSANGDFTSYAGLDTVLNNGRFNTLVLVNKSMPQGGSLSDSQLDKIQCWVDAGYPQN